MKAPQPTSRFSRPEGAATPMVAKCKETHLLVTFLLENYPNCVKPVKILQLIKHNFEELTLNVSGQSNTEHIRTSHRPVAYGRSTSTTCLASTRADTDRHGNLFPFLRRSRSCEVESQSPFLCGRSDFCQGARLLLWRRHSGQLIALALSTWKNRFRTEYR